jgi:hypothetical protein
MNAKRLKNPDDGFKGNALRPSGIINAAISRRGGRIRGLDPFDTPYPLDEPARVGS